MQRADEPKDGPSTPPRGDCVERSSQSPISVALLAALAFVPVLVAVGFLTDRSGASSVPGDISVAALRGVLDGGSDGRPGTPVVRAGY